MIDIIESKPSHVAKLKRNLRTEDVHEILRLGVSVEKALWKGYRDSIIRKTALINNEVAAMWGVSAMPLSKEGRIWLLTSPAVYHISPLKFARIYQEEVYNMLELFSTLNNWVDANHTNAIRLLEIIGFTVRDPEPVGLDRAIFRHFFINSGK